jgi:hypothetical protein
MQLTLHAILDAAFFWIDSLCILQSSVEDWRPQAAVMGEIYQGSICNLAATAARGGHDGMLMHVRRNPAYIERLSVHVPDGSAEFPGHRRRGVGAYDSIYPSGESWYGCGVEELCTL